MVVCNTYYYYECSLRRQAQDSKTSDYLQCIVFVVYLRPIPCSPIFRHLFLSSHPCPLVIFQFPLYPLLSNAVNWQHSSSSHFLQTFHFSFRTSILPSMASCRRYSLLRIYNFQLAFLLGPSLADSQFDTLSIHLIFSILVPQHISKLPT